MREIDIESLKQVIEFHGLKTKTRKRNLVYKRSFLCRTLRDMNFTYSFIGSLISKDHTTVIHALKVYDENINYIDFLEYLGELPNDIENCIINQEPVTIVKKQRMSEIEKKLLTATKYGEFVQLKRELIQTITDISI